MLMLLITNLLFRMHHLGSCLVVDCRWHLALCGSRQHTMMRHNKHAFMLVSGIINSWDSCVGIFKSRDGCVRTRRKGSITNAISIIYSRRLAPFRRAITSSFMRERTSHHCESYSEHRHTRYSEHNRIHRNDLQGSS